VFIEAKDDGGGGDNETTGAISRASPPTNQQPVFYRPDALPVAIIYTPCFIKNNPVLNSP